MTPNFIENMNIHPAKLGYDVAQAIFDDFSKRLMEAEQPIAIYPGRFQPFHAGHYSVYKQMVEEFGADRVFIVTSDKTDPEKSPLTFDEKKEIMVRMFGIPADKIIQAKNPYAPREALQNVPLDTPLVISVSEKDRDRLGGGQYYQPWDSQNPNKEGFRQRGYYKIAPEFQLRIGDKNISGTAIRELLMSDRVSDEMKRSVFEKIYGKFDEEIFKLITAKRTVKKAPKEKIQRGRKLRGDLTKAKITNPETHNQILVATALKYDKSHPAYKAAQEFVSRYLNESIQRSNNNTVKKFVLYASKQLGLKEIPIIKIVSSKDVNRIGPHPSLGAFDPDTNEVSVVLDGRLMADALRTLAHELVHRKQLELGQLTGKMSDTGTGSPLENQAHAVAGILLRNYAKKDRTIFQESVLLEGGAAGHMMHPYEDPDLTFDDLENIVAQGLMGDFGGEASEKLDGQNIMFTVVDGEVRFARNKSHIKNGGENALNAGALRQMFAGRGDLESSFGDAADDIQAAIDKLTPRQIEQLFGSGHNFVNVEIINPSAENTIPYGKSVLVFHNAHTFDDAGNMTDIMPEAGVHLAKALQDVNAARQKTYGMQGPNFIVFSSAENEEMEKATKQLTKQIRTLQNKYGLPPGATVADYREAWWRNQLQGADWIDDETKVRLARRWGRGDKKAIGAKDLSGGPKDWFRGIESNMQKYEDEMMRPLRSVILKTGALALRRVSNLVAAHNPLGGDDLKKRVQVAIDKVRATGNEDKISEMERQLAMLQSVGMDAILPSEGMVFVYNGKPYKFTGAFAPMNRILALMKYGSGEQDQNTVPRPQEPSPTTVPSRDVPPEEVPSARRMHGSVMKKTIVNPVTQNNIQIQTALKYPPDHPAHKLARQVIGESIMIEGGNEFPEVNSVVPREFLSGVSKYALQKLGIAARATLVGNTNKKILNDVDVAIDKSDIEKELGISYDDRKNFYARLISHLQSRGVQAKARSGLNQFSILIPLVDASGNHAPAVNGTGEVGSDRGMIQVDFFVGNVDWMKKILSGAPPESKYKAVVRNTLLVDIFGKMHFPTDDPSVFKRFLLDRQNGLIAQTFRVVGNKKETLDRKLVTNDPDAMASILFGEGTRWEDINSFEKLYEKFSSDRFIFKDQRQKIWSEFQKSIAAQKHPTPSVSSPVDSEREKTWWDRKIKNPETGNEIMLKTALGYDKSHPAHKLAQQVIKRG